MNTTLTAAEKWLTEMGIRNQRVGTILQVNREDMDTIANSADILIALKEALGSNKIFWGDAMMGWINLESF